MNNTHKEISKIIRLIAAGGGLTVAHMLLLSLLMHINFLRDAVYIFYYRCLYYTFILSAVLLAVLFGVKLLAERNGRTFHMLAADVILSSAVISTLFTALFVTAGLMPMDRSYSIYSVVDMYEHPEMVYSEDDVQAAFINGYIIRNQAAKRRLEEQVSIGNIEETDGGYRIGEKGARLIDLFRLIEKFYPTDEKRTLYPQYE
jgi:hypothetical protein